MKLSSRAELAVKVMLVLAEHDDGQTLPLAEVCRLRGLPRDNTARIFGMLVRAELVEAVRGRHGGYRLVKPASEISLLDVMEAVDGPLAINFCQYHPPRCDNVDCPVRPVWDEIQQTIRSVLSARTLDQLVCNHQ